MSEDHDWKSVSVSVSAFASAVTAPERRPDYGRAPFYCDEDVPCAANLIIRGFFVLWRAKI